MKGKRTKTVIGPVSVIEQLKKKAKQKVRSEGIKHHEALELLVQQRGLPNWKCLLESVDLFRPTEEAFRHGLVIAMDESEGEALLESESGIFVEDQAVSLLAEEDSGFKLAYRSIYERDLAWCNEGGHRVDFSPDEFDRAFLQFVRTLMFFRLEPSIPIPKDFKETIDLVDKYCFWEPSFAWIKGRFFEHQ